MPEVDAVIAAPVALAALGVLGKGVHWFGNLWLAISRERVAADRENAALNRANEMRIADQHSASIRHLAERVDDHTARDISALNSLANAVGQMSSQINTIATWQERVPIGVKETAFSDKRPASEPRRKTGP